jgi:hypothetical protein
MGDVEVEVAVLELFHVHIVCNYPCCLSPMITHSSQQPRKASQVKEILKKLEATASQSPPSTSSSPRSLRDSPRRQPQTDVKSEAEHNRGASRASQSSFDTLKIKPEVSPEQDSDQAGDGLPTGVPREAAAKPLEVSLRHSQPEGPPHPPVNRPASPTSGPNDQHTSPLDALLSPTTSSLPDTPSLPRDSVAESDLGEVRLNDDERFSTVSLNAAAARDSTVAVKSPIDEGAPKPWTEEDEPPPAPSEVPSASSMRASFLLQRLGNDVTSGPRRSLDGQQKLQEVFERAQRHSRDLEDEASVDWGKCSPGLFCKSYPAHTYIAFWGSVVSGAYPQMLSRPYSNSE